MQDIDSPCGTLKLRTWPGEDEHFTLTAHNDNAAISIRLKRSEVIGIAARLLKWTPDTLDTCAAHDFNDES